MAKIQVQCPQCGSRWAETKWENSHEYNENNNSWTKQEFASVYCVNCGKTSSDEDLEVAIKIFNTKGIVRWGCADY